MSDLENELIRLEMVIEKLNDNLNSKDIAHELSVIAERLGNIPDHNYELSGIGDLLEMFPTADDFNAQMTQLNHNLEYLVEAIRSLEK